MNVSIITPTYNNANYLERCIASVLKQRFKNVEHIVVDGGSNDDTLQLLKSYPHIKWISEPDKGMYDAVNKGIRMASGDVVSYLNADDRFFDYSVELVVKTFNDNPDIDFVYGYCTYIDKNEKDICTFRTLPFIPSMLPKVRISWAQPSCFWRRKIHGDIGMFDETMKNAGDEDFFRRMLIHGIKGKLVRKPLSRFMVRDDCISKTMADKLKQELAYLAKKYPLRKNGLYCLGNELLYYIMNVDGYARYVKHKLL